MTASHVPKNPEKDMGGIFLSTVFTISFLNFMGKIKLWLNGKVYDQRL